MDSPSHARWRKENPDKCREYSLRCSRKESSKEKAKAWKAANKDKVLLTAKRWQDAHPEKQRAAMKKWRDNNREYINFKDRERCANDPSYKLARMLRNRLRHVVIRTLQKKAAGTFDLTGCDIRFLMGYLEARFKPGMTWENHGDVWEVDHRIPCASYDMTKASNQCACFHYSNLQPLFVEENRRKHSKIPSTHQPELL